MDGAAHLGRQLLPMAVGALVAVAAVATCIPLPLTGDQALFSLVADELAEGRRLYTDVWDLKQPGIFWFFMAAEVAPGGSAVGAHLLELVWQLALAVVAVLVARPIVRRSWALALVPVLVVGWPYATASPAVLTQVEVLVGLPILVAIAAGLAALRTEARPDGWAVTAGAALAVVAMFKLVLVVVPVGALCVAAVASRERTRRPLRALVVGCLAAAVPVLVHLAWVASHGALEDTLRTWFEVPLGVSERVGRPVGRLRATAVDLLRFFGPVLLLAGLGTWRTLRERRHPLGLAMVAWVALGAATFLVQLWWLYLAYVVVVPLGMLAVVGVEVVLDAGLDRRWLAAGALALALLAVPTARVVAGRGRLLVEHGGGTSADERSAIARELDPSDAATSAAAADLRALAAPSDAVIVWGDPRVLLRSGHGQAATINGWSPEHLDARLWERATADLVDLEPSVVGVDAFSAGIIEARAPQLLALLHDRYRRAGEGHGFEWWVPEGPANGSEAGETGR
ncbi:hypothetical protein [Actinomarinicola tropica]|uniref:Glycosyltransferase RgtA/B/C/D-like domain-containing protein n=1 Tax=Actinomarinicola tropica TaxID=2789776 RepID=A0A5Q2RE68_9ACTN|nr:hypothetical protein [Actinomarinicola tropica]QGG95159.1 hypothetical protein GH723_08635 [Actinomarinicola tropica]